MEGAADVSTGVPFHSLNTVVENHESSLPVWSRERPGTFCAAFASQAGAEAHPHCLPSAEPRPASSNGTLTTFQELYSETSGI